MNDDVVEPVEPGMQTEIISSAVVSHVIVRACTSCGGPRVPTDPCVGCGNQTPAQITNLGVTGATYRNPLRWLIRHLVGGPLAERRIRRANQQAAILRTSAPRE